MAFLNYTWANVKEFAKGSGRPNFTSLRFLVLG
jgi:hypothetical protein